MGTESDPTGGGLSPSREPPDPISLDTNSKSRLSPDLLVGYRSDVSMSLSLDLIDLLEQLTELKTFCLLVYQFIVKRIGLGNNQMKNEKGRV